MGMLVALAVGYVLGARAGSKDLDQLLESFRKLRATDEFTEVAAAERAHLGHTLREAANMLDGGAAVPVGTGDLVDQVRHLVDQH